MNITLARTRAVYDLSEVQGALDRSKGRSPELEAFYERMLDNGAERFVTTPSSTDALTPLMDECPNFDEVVGDLRRYVRWPMPARAASTSCRSCCWAIRAWARPTSPSAWPKRWQPSAN